MADLIVFNLKTNIVVESCDMTFDETAACPRVVFECAGDKEMEESIFVDEDEPLLLSTSSPKLIPTSTLEADAPQPTISSTITVEASWVEGDIISK
jgi:hypothetical protein